MVFTAFGSSGIRSQIVILPSWLVAAYEKLGGDPKCDRRFTKSEPDGFQVTLRTPVLWPWRTLKFVMSSRSMTLISRSLNSIPQATNSRLNKIALTLMLRLHGLLLDQLRHSGWGYSLQSQ